MAHLDFSTGDPDDYWDHKDELLVSLRERLGPGADEEVIGDAGLLMDWTVNYAHGDVSRYSVEDIEEYLLSWCPRKVSVGPEGYLPIVAGAKEWITHLVLTDQWTGGPVQPLLARLDSILAEFLDAMSEPSNFGLAKGMFMGPALGGADIDLDDPESLNAAMDAFNALPHHERVALTDHLMGPSGPGALEAGDFLGAESRIDLPPTPAPDPDRAAAKAATAPLLAQLDAVREHLGERGIKLTPTGNPKLVDAKVLRDLFDTDDAWEQYASSGMTRPARSADELPHLQYLLEVAVFSGAVHDNGRTLSAAPEWDDLDPVRRCALLLSTMREVGMTQRLTDDRGLGGFDVMDELLSVGVLHLVIPAFVDGEVPYDVMLERAVEIVSGEMARPFPRLVDSASFAEMVDRALRRCVEALERCGVVQVVGVEMVQHRYLGDVASGGTVVMGDLGRTLLTPMLDALGYRPHQIADLATCSAEDAALTLSAGTGQDPTDVWSAWLPETDDADKVDLLITALEQAEGSFLRLGVTSLLGAAPGAVRRRAESIVEGPRGAYAVMAIEAVLSGDPDDDAGNFDAEPAPILLSDGRDVAEVLAGLGPGASLLPMIDLMWVEMVDAPEEFVETVDDLGTGGGATLVELLDDLWRVEVPETEELLDFLGSHHPDKHVAKAARKALFRHRSLSTSS